MKRGCCFSWFLFFFCVVSFCCDVDAGKDECLCDDDDVLELLPEWSEVKGEADADGDHDDDADV